MSSLRSHLPAALIASLALLGCDSDSEPAAATTAPAAEKPAQPDAAAPADGAGADEGKSETTGEADKPAGGGKIEIAPAERDRLKTDAARVRTHLGAARDRVSSSEWKVAIEEFNEALKLDDDNPHILTEMAWAQFNDGQLDKAEHNLRAALRYERVGDRRAELLYKLGRVEEERGDWVKAKEHYDHSLRLKDDSEAREHDEAVSEKAAAACAEGACVKPDYTDLAAACAAMVARVHEQQGLPAHSADSKFVCDPGGAKKVALSGGDATEAVVLVVKGEHAGTSEEEHDLLVHIEGGWHWVGTLLDVENPHHGGIMRSGTLKSFEAKELLPDSPGTEVLIQVELLESDVDLDDNMIYHDEHEAYVVCGVNAGTHVCHEIPTRMTWDAEALDPSQPAGQDLASHSFDATAEFDGAGNVTVTGTGEIPAEEKGTHKISELPEPKGFVFLHED
jgi:tetratricopeptide (TPR) repeat protein